MFHEIAPIRVGGLSWPRGLIPTGISEFFDKFLDATAKDMIGFGGQITIQFCEDTPKKVTFRKSFVKSTPFLTFFFAIHKLDYCA